MTETRNDPRYIRVVGLTLLAALLVVASCGVEQPPTTAATSGSSEGDERMVVPRTEEFEVGVEPVVIDSVACANHWRHALQKYRLHPQ